MGIAQPNPIGNRGVQQDSSSYSVAAGLEPLEHDGIVTSAVDPGREGWHGTYEAFGRTRHATQQCRLLKSRP